jgi:hypothetical protein
MPPNPSTPRSLILNMMIERGPISIRPTADPDYVLLCVRVPKAHTDLINGKSALTTVIKDWIKSWQDRTPVPR